MVISPRAISYGRRPWIAALQEGLAGGPKMRCSRPLLLAVLHACGLGRPFIRKLHPRASNPAFSAAASVLQPAACEPKLWPDASRGGNDMRGLPSPRGRAGRLDLAGALVGWLRGCRGAHIYNAPEALSTAGEAQGLRDFAFEPLGGVDEAQEKLLRCGRACESCGRRGRPPGGSGRPPRAGRELHIISPDLGDFTMHLCA